MYHWKGYKKGFLLGTQYFFPKIGDGLPMHNHGLEDRHNVIVLNGSCLVYGLNKTWSYRLNQGAVFHFQEDEYPHEIAALEEKTVILNLTIYGDKFLHLKNWANHDHGDIVYDSITIPLTETDTRKMKSKRKKL